MKNNSSVLLILLTACAALFTVLSCSGRKDQDLPLPSEQFSGKYKNSSARHACEYIEIVRHSDKNYLVEMIGNGNRSTYTAVTEGKQIYIILESGRKLYMYKNGNELRVYISGDGDMPEDVDWTFYPG